MKRIRKQKYLVLTAVALLLLIAVVVLAGANRKANVVKPQGSTSPSPSVTLGNSTHDEPSPSPTAASTPAASPGSATLENPTLQKSSGNNGPVPVGAGMEFTCIGSEGLACEVILTDKTNPSRVITLPKKTIASDGRGQYFAILSWAAVAGNWTVVARVSNSSGATATSAAQSLEVK